MTKCISQSMLLLFTVQALSKLVTAQFFDDLAALLELGTSTFAAKRLT